MKQSKLSQKQIHYIFLLIGLIVFVWSFIGHYDTFGWFALVLIIILGVSYFIITYNKFTFSTFVYFFWLLWIIILLVGAKYTYSLNPWFAHISDNLNLTRNYYDRVGHFAQGFVPFMIIKEFLYRKKVLKPSKFTTFLLIALVLSFSAAYELVEFGVAEITNQPESYILDTQGDNWDTQWDMLLAIIGAGTSSLVLGKRHDEVIFKIMEEETMSE
jgi:putative membrane protein